MPKSLPTKKVRPLNPSEVCCPNAACVNRGHAGRGNITIHSQQERRYHCRTCGKTFAATKGTPFYRLHLEAVVMRIVLILLAHGCPPQAIVAAFALDERTVTRWALTAGAHCQQMHEHLIATGQVPGCVVQADELWIKVVGRKLWQAMALVAESRVWLGGVISPTRDTALITALVTRVHASLTRRDLTVCVDGLASYVTVFLSVFREKVRPATKRLGRWRLVIVAGLRIGQVVKRYAGKRVCAVEERGVRGSAASIRRRVQQAGVGQHIHTAFIERLNATFRAHWAGLTRRGRAIVRTEALATAGMWLVGCCYNWCWAHDSLRVATPAEAARKWHEQTPAMAAGLTDHIWSMDELLWYQVPLPAWVPPIRRGRKPKPKSEPPPIKRMRGRPKGSKNRPKEVVA